ncbi:MAG: hypothetical protein M1840_006321 [Geoglossum simile]|nr:MAG: hypothetical protein M1840_006321 [Geoglossum simile]
MAVAMASNFQSQSVPLQMVLQILAPKINVDEEHTGSQHSPFGPSGAIPPTYIDEIENNMVFSEDRPASSDYRLIRHGRASSYFGTSTPKIVFKDTSAAASHTTPSMTELTSIAATSTQSGKLIKDTLVDVLKPLPKKRQLAELLNLFNKAVDLDEVISEVVSEAWYYLTTTGLWSLEYPDLKTLQKSIGYEQFVATALKKHSLDVVNKQSQAKGILKNA